MFKSPSNSMVCVICHRLSCLNKHSLLHARSLLTGLQGSLLFSVSTGCYRCSLWFEFNILFFYQIQLLLIILCALKKPPVFIRSWVWISTTFLQNLRLYCGVKRGVVFFCNVVCVIVHPIMPCVWCVNLKFCLMFQFGMGLCFLACVNVSV